MNRDEVLKQITDTFGSVPGWLAAFPESQLEHIWGIISWVTGDSRLSSKEKALIGFGAAASVHCPY